MDPRALEVIIQALQQINELSGGALDALLSAAEAGGPPAEEGAAPPAPGGEPAQPPVGPPA